MEVMEVCHVCGRERPSRVMRLATEAVDVPGRGLVTLRLWFCGDQRSCISQSSDLMGERLHRLGQAEGRTVGVGE